MKTQTEDVKKLGRATNYLHDIKGLGLEPAEGEERAVFRRRVGQVTAELEDVRDLLTASARAVLSQRQLEVLEPEGEEEADLLVDPSVQFLGLEWEAIFGKCFNLGLNIRIYRQRLESGMVDTLTLALVLRELQRVMAEVALHARVVLRPEAFQKPKVGCTMWITLKRGEAVEGISTQALNLGNTLRAPIKDISKINNRKAIFAQKPKKKKSIVGSLLTMLITPMKM
jgi:hypothetical protein